MNVDLIPPVSQISGSSISAEKPLSAIKQVILEKGPKFAPTHLTLLWQPSCFNMAAKFNLNANNF